MKGTHPASFNPAPAARRLHFSQGRPILAPLAAASGCGVCPVCLRPMPPARRAGNTVASRCARCEEAFRRAEQAGRLAGQQERRALGLDEPRSARRPAPMRRYGRFDPAPLRPSTLGRLPDADGGDGDRDAFPTRPAQRTAVLLFAACLVLSQWAAAGALPEKFPAPRGIRAAALELQTLPFPDVASRAIQAFPSLRADWAGRGRREVTASFVPNASRPNIA